MFKWKNYFEHYKLFQYIFSEPNSVAPPILIQSQ